MAKRNVGAQRKLRDVPESHSLRRHRQGGKSARNRRALRQLGYALNREHVQHHPQSWADSIADLLR